MLPFNTKDLALIADSAMLSGVTAIHLAGAEGVTTAVYNWLASPKTAIVFGAGYLVLRFIVLLVKDVLMPLCRTLQARMSCGRRFKRRAD
jgi:hypothetical protein